MKLLYSLISLLLLLSVSFGQMPNNFESGYFLTNETTGAHLFFLFYPSQVPSDKLLIFLSGGPGCSSELAAFFENGPYNVNPNLTLAENPYSWNKVANVLYIDSPVGTGFSYVTNPDGYSHTELEVSQNLYSLLTQFYTKYQDYAKMDLYIFGESYAGHYVPSFSYYIYEQNNNNPSIVVPLKGLAVGNAMVDPYIQYGSLGLYAFTHNLITYNEYQETQGLYESCKAAIKSGDYNMTSTICNEIMTVIQDYAGPFNQYDVTKTCLPTEPLCYNFTSVTNFLNLPQVKQQLGVETDYTWNMCNSVPYSEIIHDWFNSPIDYIPTLLENYKVLVYSGINGWICNFIGSLEWMASLNYGDFNSQTQQVAYIDQEIVGHYQTYKNLAFFGINGAGHMAPHDAPETTFEMVKMFLNNTI